MPAASGAVRRYVLQCVAKQLLRRTIDLLMHIRRRPGRSWGK